MTKKAYVTSLVFHCVFKTWRFLCLQIGGGYTPTNHHQAFGQLTLISKHLLDCKLKIKLFIQQRR